MISSFSSLRSFSLHQSKNPVSRPRFLSARRRSLVPLAFDPRLHVRASRRTCHASPSRPPTARTGLSSALAAHRRATPIPHHERSLASPVRRSTRASRPRPRPRRPPPAPPSRAFSTTSALGTPASRSTSPATRPPASERPAGRHPAHVSPVTRSFRIVTRSSRRRIRVRARVAVRASRD